MISPQELEHFTETQFAGCKLVKEYDESVYGRIKVFYINSNRSVGVLTETGKSMICSINFDSDKYDELLHTTSMMLVNKR
jgi:hypothetical protein